MRPCAQDYKKHELEVAQFHRENHGAGRGLHSSSFQLNLSQF